MRAFAAPEWCDRLDSTSSELLRRLAAGVPLQPGFVLAVHAQTAGRGRGQRSWVSGAGQDLAFSFLAELGPDAAALPMAVALGVRDAMDAAGVAAQTKWPNDVLVRGRKIAGILSEVGPDSAGRDEVCVVGVGINVNMGPDAADAVGRPVTSLQIETGRVHRPSALLPAVLACIAPWMERWRAAGFAGLRAGWEEHAVWQDAAVALRDGTRVREGILAGYGAGGELLLREADGTLQPIWSGDLLRARTEETR